LTENLKFEEMKEIEEIQNEVSIKEQSISVIDEMQETHKKLKCLIANDDALQL